MVNFHQQLSQIGDKRFMCHDQKSPSPLLAVVLSQYFTGVCVSNAMTKSYTCSLLFEISATTPIWH